MAEDDCLGQMDQIILLKMSPLPITDRRLQSFVIGCGRLVQGSSTSASANRVH